MLFGLKAVVHIIYIYIYIYTVLASQGLIIKNMVGKKLNSLMKYSISH